MTADEMVRPLASTSTRSRRCATRAAARQPSVLEAVERVPAAGAPGITVHPRADERHITPDDVREIARVLEARRPASRVQHRRRSAAGSDRSRATRCGPTSARWCPSRPAKSPARPDGGRVRQTRPAARRSSRDLQAARHPRQPVRRRRARADSLGRVGRRRSRRALHRAVRARLRARPRRGARVVRTITPPPRSSRTALGLGVNAGHDLDLDNLVALPRAAVSRRGVDRPRHHFARASLSVCRHGRALNTSVPVARLT